MTAVDEALVALGISVVRTAVDGIKIIREIIIACAHSATKTIRTPTLNYYRIRHQIDRCAVANANIIATKNFFATVNASYSLKKIEPVLSTNPLIFVKP